MLVRIQSGVRRQYFETIYGKYLLFMNPMLEKLRATIRQILNESYFEDEGPQPGDAAYHSQRSQPLKLSKLNDVNWRSVHEVIIGNTAILHEKAIDGITYNLGDIYDELGVPTEWMKMLEDHDVIELVDNTYPVFYDNTYLEYPRFFAAVEKAWNSPPQKVDTSSSSLRYRDDGGTDGG